MRAISTALLLTGTFLVTPALAETITVGPGGSIQDAVNRARAGDTVSVAPGDYRPFEITRNGVTVRSSVAGGARVVATTGRAISAYGQSNITIEGFRVSAPRSDGVAITGAPGRLVSGVRISGLVVENAGRDGIKVAQLQNSQVSGNRILRGGTLGTAGSSGNRNGDGGIDCVTCQGVLFQENVVSTQGWAALMLKGNSRGNRIVNNTFTNTDGRGSAIAVGGLTSGRASAAAGVTGNAGSEASGNVLQGNILNSAGCAFSFIDAANNQLSNNQITQRRNCPISEGSNNGDANVTTTPTGPIAPAGPINGDSGNAGNAGGAGDDGDDSSQGLVMASAGGRLGSSCSGAGSLSNATSAAGAVSSLFSGGRATAPLQVAQQLQLVAQRICQTEQLIAQIRMLKSLDTNAVVRIRSLERRVTQLFGSIDDALYTANAGRNLHDRYQTGMPEDWTFENAAQHTKTMREQTDLAAQEAAAVNAESMAMVEEALDLSDAALELSQGAEGQTQAIQAQSQIMRSFIAVAAAQHASSTAAATAALRSAEEQRAQEITADQKIERFYGPGSLEARTPTGRHLFQ